MRAVIDLSSAGRQLTNFPSSSTVCVHAEQRSSGQHDVPLQGCWAYQALASLSNMPMIKIFGVTPSARFPKDENNARLATTFGGRDRPYFRCLGPGEKQARDAVIKLANSSREGSILIEYETKEHPLTGTSYRSVRRPSYFYVMRRSGAEPEPNAGPRSTRQRLQADGSVRNLHS